MTKCLEYCGKFECFQKCAMTEKATITNHYEQALKDIMKVCENSRAYTESAHAYFIAKKALEHGKEE